MCAACRHKVQFPASSACQAQLGFSSLQKCRTEFTNQQSQCLVPATASCYDCLRQFRDKLSYQLRLTMNNYRYRYTKPRLLLSDSFFGDAWHRLTFSQGFREVADSDYPQLLTLFTSTEQLPISLGHQGATVFFAMILQLLFGAMSSNPLCKFQSDPNCFQLLPIQATMIGKSMEMYQSILPSSPTNESLSMQSARNEMTVRPDNLIRAEKAVSRRHKIVASTKNKALLLQTPIPFQLLPNPINYQQGLFFQDKKSFIAN